MKIGITTIALCALLLTHAAALAQSAPTDASRSALSALTNPAISVIGWIQAAAGNDRDAQASAFEFKEAELSLQADVDPFTRAEFYIAFTEEAVEVEEGYITWLALPGGGQAKAGKFRADLGKFNRTHPPETPFADRPLVTGAFLGEEGLLTTGLSLSALIPNPWDAYWDVTGNVGAAPEGIPAFEEGGTEEAHGHAEGSPTFGGEAREDLLWLGRTSLFLPLGEGTDANLGFSYANAQSNERLRVDGNRQQLATADVTLKWKKPRRSIYRSLTWQTEWTWQQGSSDSAIRRSGGFTYAVYQFARRWRAGARYDWTELPGTDLHTSGALALVSFQPSEFSMLSLQARRVREIDGTERDAAFLKWTFNIGPHGSHPY